jgi:hypothetical protein
MMTPGNCTGPEWRKRLRAMFDVARDVLRLGEAAVLNPAMFKPVTLPAHLQATNNDQ